MSTYYNAQKANGFNLNRIVAPKYLKEFLNYELVIKNLAPRTVHNYYMSLRLFLLWLGQKQKDDCQEIIPLDNKKRPANACPCRNSGGSGRGRGNQHRAQGRT